MPHDLIIPHIFFLVREICYFRDTDSQLNKQTNKNKKMQETKWNMANATLCLFHYACLSINSIFFWLVKNKSCYNNFFLPQKSV